MFNSLTSENFTHSSDLAAYFKEGITRPYMYSFELAYSTDIFQVGKQSAQRAPNLFIPISPAVNTSSRKQAQRGECYSGGVKPQGSLSRKRPLMTAGLLQQKTAVMIKQIFRAKSVYKHVFNWESDFCGR